jgi:hypothetical protein
MSSVRRVRMTFGDTKSPVITAFSRSCGLPPVTYVARGVADGKVAGSLLAFALLSLLDIGVS